MNSGSIMVRLCDPGKILSQQALVFPSIEEACVSCLWGLDKLINILLVGST